MGKQTTVFKYRIVAVGSESLRLGMGLAGVKETFPSEDIERLANQEDVGMIITEDESRLRRKYENSAKPIFVFVPRQGEKLLEEESLRRLIKRAIGIDLLKND